MFYRRQTHITSTLCPWFILALLIAVLTACDEPSAGSQSGPGKSTDRASVELRTALSGHQWHITPNASTLYDDVTYSFRADGTGTVNESFGSNYSFIWSVDSGRLLVGSPTSETPVNIIGLAGYGDARIVNDTVVWEMAYFSPGGGYHKILLTLTSPDFNPATLDSIPQSQSSTVNQNLNKDGKIVYSFERGARLMDNTAQLSDTIHDALKDFSSTHVANSSGSCPLGGSANYFYSDNDGSSSVTAIDSLTMEFINCEMFTVGNFGGAIFNGTVSVTITTASESSDYPPLVLESWVADVDVSQLTADQRDLYGKAEWNGVFELSISDHFGGTSISYKNKTGFSLDYVDGSDVVAQLDVTRRDAGLLYEVEVDLRTSLTGINDELTLNNADNLFSGEYDSYFSSGKLDMTTRDSTLQVSATVLSGDTNVYSYYPSIQLGGERKWSKVTNGALSWIGEESKAPTLGQGSYDPDGHPYFERLSINPDGTFERFSRKHVNEPGGTSVIAKTHSVRGKYRDTATSLHLLPETEYVCNIHAVMESITPTVAIQSYSLDIPQTSRTTVITDADQTDWIYAGLAYAPNTEPNSECYPDSSSIFSGDFYVIDNLGPDIVEQEPNDDETMVTSLTYPSAVTGGIGPNDAVDYYGFRPPVSGSYKVYLEYPENAEIWMHSLDTAPKFTGVEEMTNGIRYNMNKDSDYRFSVFWRPSGYLGSVCFVDSNFNSSDSRCTDGPADAIAYKLYFEFLH